MVINLSVHQTQTWIGDTCASSVKGAHPHGRTVKMFTCPIRHALPLKFKEYQFINNEFSSGLN